MSNITKQNTELNDHKLFLLFEQGVAVIDNGDDTSTLSSIQLSDDALSSLYDSLDDLARAKEVKIVALKDATGVLLKSGFESVALGEAYVYASADWEDQINILGAMIAGVDLPFTCNKMGEPERRQYMHTAAEMTQVYTDGVVFKQTALAVLQIKIDEVSASTKIADVEAITL